jgi:hypothetical protein
MATLELTFINTNDGQELDADIEDTYTCNQIIQQLITERFIPQVIDSNRTFYSLTIKGRNTINENQTLRDAGAHSGDKIVVAEIQRGGSFTRLWEN